MRGVGSECQERAGRRGATVEGCGSGSLEEKRSLPRFHLAFNPFIPDAAEAFSSGRLMKEIAEGSSHLRLANLRTWICWIPGLTVSLTNTVVEKVQEYCFSSFQNKQSLKCSYYFSRGH